MPILLHHAHSWAVSPKEAIAIQRHLAALVSVDDDLPAIRHVAGVDVGFEQHGTIARAAVAVLHFPALTLLEGRIARQPARFPYIPGLLSFREIPAIVAAMEQLTTEPDVILVDGQGFSHPRRFGIACHLGVLTGFATIGVAKTRLTGMHDAVPTERGCWTPLRDGPETIGAVLRTRAGVKPVYISVGHRISLPTAVQWAMRCTGRYRLPETTRYAHRLASG